MNKPPAETYLHGPYHHLIQQIRDNLTEIERRSRDPSGQPSLFDTDRGGTTDSESTEPSKSSTRTATDPSGSASAASKPMSRSATEILRSTGSVPNSAETDGADHANENEDGSSRQT